MHRSLTDTAGTVVNLSLIRYARAAGVELEQLAARPAAAALARRLDAEAIAQADGVAVGDRVRAAGADCFVLDRRPGLAFVTVRGVRQWLPIAELNEHV